MNMNTIAVYRASRCCGALLGARRRLLADGQRCRHLPSSHQVSQRRPSQSAPQGRSVVVRDGMTVSELARVLDTTPRDIMRILSSSGTKFTGTSSELSMEQSELVASTAGFIPTRATSRDLVRQQRDHTSLRPRPPVVTVMGHVDHGKTTLLDWLRQTSTAAREAGGITQHIGAFSVQLSTGDRLTFLDTPGHAAFSAMRARGAGLTDLVVLVVAADDGVMAQTRECIELVREASVPLVVAVNKCDKPGVDPSGVEKGLLQCSVQLEQFGGDVQCVHISALTGSGVPQLEEALLAEAELSAVRGDPTGPVEAVVIEAHVDRGLGPVASVVVRHGTLKCGDVLVAGRSWGKVRALFVENRRPVKEAPPSTPVLTVGWKELPPAGEECLQAESEAAARSVVEYRTSSSAVGRAANQLRSREGKRNVGVLVKGDVVGSVEVLVGILETRQPEGVALRVVDSGVGAVVYSDIQMAASTGSVILAFGVPCTKSVQALASLKGVSILTHNVIYKLLDSLKSHVEESLPWTEEEEVVGEAVVLKTFQLTGARAASVGGCRVKSGRLLRSATYRLLRDGEVVHDGRLSAMKHGKSDVSEARKETECGLSFSSSSVQWREGDKVVAYTTRRVPPTLLWDFGF